MNSVEKFLKRIDCHVHVFDPVRFPYSKNSLRFPLANEAAPVGALLDVMNAHNIDHALIVTPTTGYGRDNGAMMDAVGRYPNRFRGIAVVNSTISVDELAELKTSGVAGVRLDLVSEGASCLSKNTALLEKLIDLDMCIQIQTDSNSLKVATEHIRQIAGRVVFDHMGRPDPALGVDHRDFTNFLNLAEREQTYVKLSGPFRFSVTGYPFVDADKFGRAVVREFGPERCVWGSDWPFVGVRQRLDYGPTLDALYRWCGDESALQSILWQTPQSLFGFEGVSI